MSLTQDCIDELRKFSAQLVAHGLRVYWLNSNAGAQIKVYSTSLDSFANVYLRRPQHIWVYSTDRRPSRENGTGLCVIESHRLHPAHVLEALKISTCHPDRTTAADWERRGQIPSWIEITA